MADAIVIGAGINGLTAAAALAAKGWGVTVFERNEEIGGAVRTAELTQPGFRHDWGALNLSLFAGSGFHARFGEDLARHGLEFVPVSDCFATAFPDGRWLGVSTDPALTSARIAGESAADAARWQAMLGEFAEDAPHIFSVLGSPMTPASLARTAFRIWRKRDSAFLLKLARLMFTSPRTFLEENFESPRVQAMCAAWGMHLDFPPDQSGGAVFPYLEAMANQSFGMVIGKGGADTVTRALRGMIEARGGRIETGAEVTEILVESGVASGVRLADGRVERAGGAVIANLAPRGLMRLLPRGSGEAGYDARMQRFRHAPGTMMLHLALDGLPDWAAGAELKRFMYVHLAPSLQQMSETYTQAVNGLLPREPVLVVGQPGTADPSRAPEGKHTLWVQVRMVPGTIRGDAAGAIDATDWEAAKEPMTDRVLDILERYAPGLRARILGQCVMSPAELESGNPNLVGGDQIAGSHHPYQNFLFRPVPGRADWSTPVPKLHHVGASTWPGGGTGAGSGTMLAEKLAGR
ncbi:NAD(P)/FAD-dependent oxidoreductase [Rhodosalinus halophilus]|uniref:Pyridine nucleotide-disulfide oxidoreductase domain-containing protein 2 n=1 Tax=Rhodosalinus halophilus TaxID=2259333 RepID=A0A365UDX5_9RHOB|nr:NAD(P)/FAD-dependent oxidoreductase [Rhodosalinus halophilus]RBI87739.1 NAD(P)/FAD-dependent oxidoreductase [Rhodosalinus halophilus]